MVEMYVPTFHRIMLPSSSGYSSTSHDGGNASLLHVNPFLPDYMASHSRRVYRVWTK